MGAILMGDVVFKREVRSVKSAGRIQSETWNLISLNTDERV
jgi:hypothetical protein